MHPGASLAAGRNTIRLLHFMQGGPPAVRVAELEFEGAEAHAIDSASPLRGTVAAEAAHMLLTAWDRQKLRGQLGEPICTAFEELAKGVRQGHLTAVVWSCSWSRQGLPACLAVCCHHRQVAVLCWEQHAAPTCSAARCCFGGTGMLGRSAASARSQSRWRASAATTRALAFWNLANLAFAPPPLHAAVMRWCCGCWTT